MVVMVQLLISQPVVERRKVYSANVDVDVVATEATVAVAGQGK